MQRMLVIYQALEWLHAWVIVLLWQARVYTERFVETVTTQWNEDPAFFFVVGLLLVLAVGSVVLL